jgi:hypothetical protein
MFLARSRHYNAAAVSVTTTLLIGAAIHAVIGAGVFFAPDEPHRFQIFVATTLKGLLVALLIGFTIQCSPRMVNGALAGLLYGLSFGLVVFLAKGASFRSTPHLLGGSALQGVITGALVAAFAFR